MESKKQGIAVLLSALTCLWLVVTTVAFGGLAAADQHTYEEAPELGDSAGFTIEAVSPSDHYPGDINEENASLRYFSAGEDAFRENDAEEGIWFNQILVTADWIDYTACDTDNTAAFGIDRGNNNEGTQIDEDLVQYQRRSVFKDDGIDIFFYNWEDFAGNPPYMAPEDAIVSEQGENSNAGACLTMTNEPGWYQIHAFFNGTIANEDCTESSNDNCEPENKERVGGHLYTNYFYVCECDNEDEAYEALGPPPNEGPEPTETPESTPTPEATETPAGDDSEATPAATETPEPADTPAETAGPAEPTATGNEGEGDDGNAAAEQAAAGGDDGGAGGTPTPGDAPGFGPIAALIALLASTLLLYRHG